MVAGPCPREDMALAVCWLQSLALMARVPERSSPHVRSVQRTPIRVRADEGSKKSDAKKLTGSAIYGAFAG